MRRSSTRCAWKWSPGSCRACSTPPGRAARSEEHTSELQSQSNLVCRLLLEKKKNQTTRHPRHFPSTPCSSTLPPSVPITTPTTLDYLRPPPPVIAAVPSARCLTPSPSHCSG